MSFENLSFQRLDILLQEFVEENEQVACKVKELRDLVLTNPKKNNFYDITSLTWKTGKMKLTEKILLGVLHWYFPEELRFTFHLELERIWGSDFKEIREVLLTSKKTALGFLLIQDRWDERAFLGFLNERSLRTFLTVKFRITDSQKTGKFKKLNFRDYKDKGSKPPEHHREPVYNFRKLLSEEDLFLRRMDLESRIKDLLIQIEDRLKMENVS